MLCAFHITINKVDKGGVYQKKEWSIDTLDYLDESQMHHAEDKKKKKAHTQKVPFVWPSHLYDTQHSDFKKRNYRNRKQISGYQELGVWGRIWL